MATLTNRARTVWRTCLAAAARTGLACAIVGWATLYGPVKLRDQIGFPAFSYVTVILIITDATFGDALNGCWHAIYATVQGVCPAVLVLLAIGGPGHLTVATTTIAVWLSAFAVALLENTHVVCKRIALGQIVIVYVLAFIKGTTTDTVTHTIQVTVSTGVGVVACVLALLLPYPSLACFEVKQNCRLFADNAAERLKLFVKAFCAEDNISAQAFISQAKSLVVTGTKLLQSIKCKQVSMQWERLPITFLKPYCTNPGEILQDLETPLRGMDIALSNSQSFPLRSSLEPELKDGLLRLENHLTQTLNHIKTCMPFDLSTAPEPNTEDTIKPLQAFQTIPQTQKELPSFFFLFCLKLLRNKLTTTSSSSNPSPKKPPTASPKQNRWFLQRRFMPAFKSSLSLGLAVLLGLIYSKYDGFWAGLPVAITFAAARQATFMVANVKAQGTVLGTIYGVLGCFLFQRYVHIRFLSLLPWFIFTCFLKRSRMYGQAGGVSAVIGGVIILGRDNFGTPSDFAIARITETFIGLSCSILVDLMLQPTRASTLAKTELCKCLHLLNECFDLMSVCSNKSNLENKLKKLKFHVNELRKFTLEAEVEPNFWFLPFHTGCYSGLVGSLSKMVDFLLFGTHATGFIVEQQSQITEGAVWKDTINKLYGDIEGFKEMVGSSMKCFEEVTMIKSLTTLDNELQKRNISYDIELGKSPIPIMLRSSGADHEGEIEKITSSYLQISKEVLDQIPSGDVDKGVDKSQLVLGLSALAFCMTNLVRETREIEKRIQELIQWENPTSHVNLYEISCKIHALDN